MPKPARFHLTGIPTMPVQEARSLVNHTRGAGEFELFRRMAEPVVCGSAVITPQNVAYETERLIAAALKHRKPLYLVFPADLAAAWVLGHGAALNPRRDGGVHVEVVTERYAAAPLAQRLHDNTDALLPRIIHNQEMT